MSDCLVAIPVYNEEENLESFLETLHPYRNNVLIINDGSTDRSGEIIDKKKFESISYEDNKGLEAFHQDAFKVAIRRKLPCVITMDSDGQHDVSFLMEFVEQLKSNDLVIGNRFRVVKQDIPTEKIAANAFGSDIYNQLFKRGFQDVTCGFRGYRVDKINDIAPGFRWPYAFIFYLMLGVLRNKGRISSVEMPAIYPDMPVYFTSTIELLSFFEALIFYYQEQNYHRIYTDFLQRKDTCYHVLGNNYYFEYLSAVDGYRVSLY